MYFEVNVTPKEKTSVVPQAEPETKFSLLLAPFQPPTHMRIETGLYTTAKCYLTLRNPNNRSLNVQVTKAPPAERAVALNLNELKIGPDGDAELVVSWTARQPGTFRDIIQLTDSRRIKYNISLTTSTTGGAKKNGNSNLKSKDYNQSQMVGTKKKFYKQNTSPKKKPDSKRSLSENIMEDVNVTNKRHKTSYAPSYQDKENISNNGDVSWQTPSKRSASIRGIRQDRSFDVSSSKIGDFSALIESDKFNLTPHSLFKNEAGIKKENSSPDSAQFTLQNYTAMLSPPRTSLQVLRRETYLTTPVFPNATFTNKDSRDDFEDSLSPPEQKPILNSDFSMLINEINFASDTPMAPAAAEPNNAKCNFFTPTLDKNNTFEVLTSSEVIESHVITTLHSLGSSEITRLAPTRLARSFATLSPVMPVIEPRATKFATSSSPICNNEGSQAGTNFRLNVDGYASASRQLDTSSVQEVLEADLWAKPINQCPLSAIRSGPTSLESIQEESARLTPITNKTYVKCSNESHNSNASSSVAHRRFEFSPPMVNKGRKTSPIRKISPKKYSKVSKDKSIQELQGLKRKAAMNTSMKSRGERLHSIPGVRIAKLSLAGLTQKRGNGRASESEVSTKLHDPENFFTMLCNPDPFAATMTEDPFLASTLYFDDKWVKNQEIEFKKWLNALLTPPEHLTSNVDTPLIDVAKVWQTCRQKEDVSLAETKEALSARYHTNQRLDTLRRAACTMLRSNEVVAVLSRVTVCVEKGVLVIRQDRDLHKDIGLQKLVLELLLCYNPLWLRIALEAIYGETIPLNSNNDIIRLSKFLLARFFSDPYLVSTHSHQTVQNLRLPTFFALMNKFMLKKFLFIVYFLDYAKTHKLIGHDPCLFHKQAIYKESRRILLKFSQELLSGVGDVTRVLKPYGYILTHRQTELDEYSYAVNCLSLDLRDGVRLCRVMELITGKRNLTAICRVPAISRLQKVHNVNVALQALAGSGYTVRGNITAKCIADGHREKTLSLLWQIIYKFQAPHFNKAAATIQRWWSSKVWWLRIRNFLKQRRNNAACVIQRAWRSYLARKELVILRENRARIMAVKNNAARVIQVKWIARAKMTRDRKAFQQRKSAVVAVQKYWRNYRATKPFVESLNRKRSAALMIQRRWRATKSMRSQLSAYLILVRATVKIQYWWRQKLAKKADRKRDEETTRAAVLIQNKWRANRLMKIDRQEFLRKINAVKTVQNWWRSEILCRNDRNNFLILKSSAITVQRTFRAWKEGCFVRKEFLTLRSNVILVQRKWQVKKLAQPIREDYLTKRRAVVAIQTWWRALVLAKRIETEYEALRSMTILIQRKYRANKLAVSTREEFLSLKSNVICIQRKWRLNKSMRECRESFAEKRAAAVKIQIWWRACLEAKGVKYQFALLKTTTILIQRRYRALRAGAVVREEYKTLRTFVICIQQKWRAKKLAQPTREDFLMKRRAAVKIQRWWRTRRTVNDYKALRSTTILIQRKYRANKLAVVTREEFLLLKSSVICVQQKWRAKRSMRECRSSYMEKCEAVGRIQMWWRACLKAKEAKSHYETLKTMTILIQRRYRAAKVGALVRQEYRTLRTSVVRIQQKWQAKKLARPIREDFLSKRRATIKIQSWWRMQCAEANYSTLKYATILIQRKYRANKLAIATREDFLTLRASLVIVQRKWRANKSMKLERDNFLQNRRSVVIIQRWWRSIKASRICRESYEKQRAAAIRIQRWYRATVAARIASENDIGVVRSTVKIQRWWREILMDRRRWRERRASAATVIQAVWRAHKVRRMYIIETNKLRERSVRAAVEAQSSASVTLRLNTAISMFQECGNLGRLTQGLTALDTITHLMPHTSTVLCTANMVGSLYDVLDRTNRSRPWMDICLRASSILVTIAKYAPTKKYAWQEEYVKTIVHLMSVTLERETNVFLHLATLLWLLADSPARIKTIAESPNTAWSLSCMYETVSKKKSKPSMGSKQPSTTSNLLPNPKPDWGLKHSRPRTFTSVNYAVHILYKKLQIKQQVQSR